MHPLLLLGLRLLIFAAVLVSAICAKSERTWTYEPISVSTSTADESKLKVGFQIVRISRGVFAVSGEIDWNYDVGDDTMVEMLSFRSATGSNDYQQMPFSVPKQPFYDYINNVYKDVTMKNFANCSNLPQFEDKFDPPWAKQIYTFERCVIDGEGLPTHMPEGFYKIKVTVSGEVEWTLEITAKVSAKLV